MTPIRQRETQGILGGPSFDVRTPSSPAENLARFRWHTGAEPKQVFPESAPAMLFRDVGPAAMARFLRVGLHRLAGPVTPITYLRTADYREPYVDYGAIGRLVVMRPMELRPWHCGLSHIFIAAAARMPASDALAFVPGGMDLHEATRRLDGARTRDEAREAFAGADDCSARTDHLERLDLLNKECVLMERFGQPLRIALQTGDAARRERVRECLEQHGIDEDDLCAAWHHLRPERRDLLKEMLPRMHQQMISWIPCGK